MCELNPAIYRICSLKNSSHNTFNMSDMASGTGFMLTPDALITEPNLIITNAHVVANSSHIYIQSPLCQKTNLGVECISICHDYDLALLRLTSDASARLHSILLSKNMLNNGDFPSLSLKIHESVDFNLQNNKNRVTAIGYPLGVFQQKICHGFLSGTAHVNGVNGKNMLLQITTAINPGNSGGPLLNPSGEAIGITSSQYTNSQLTNFAIPTRQIQNCWKYLYVNQPTKLTMDQLNQILSQMYPDQVKNQSEQHNETKVRQILSNYDNADQQNLFKNFKVFASRFDDYKLFDGGLNKFIDNCVFETNSLRLVNHDLFDVIFHHVVNNDIGRAQKLIQTTNPPNQVPNKDVRGLLLQAQNTTKIVAAPLVGLYYHTTTGAHTSKYYLKNCDVQPIETMGNGVILHKVVKNTILHDVGCKVGDFVYQVNDESLNEFGNVYRKNGKQYSLRDVVSRIPWGEECTFDVLRLNEGVKKITFALEPPKSLPPIRMIHPMEQNELNQKANIHGIVLTTLRLNHVKQFSPLNPELMKYAVDVDMRNQFKLIIQQISPECVGFTHEILTPGLIVDSINENKVAPSWNEFVEQVKEIQQKELEVQKKLRSNEKCNYTFTLKTSCNKLFVVSI